MTREKKFADGLNGLKNPILPLVRIIQILYITGPFETIDQILEELNEPIETNAVRYDNPQESLAPYLDILKEFEWLKSADGPDLPYTIMDQDNQAVEIMEAIGLMVSQQMLARELERINSQLCGPCGCNLCCIGPDESLQQEFFEIPLNPPELKEFPLEMVDSAESRQRSPYSEDPLIINNKPFYQGGPRLFHWQNGWSLILPKGANCPQLELQKSNCQIYPRRPDVCRRPQIFPYILERKSAGQEIYIQQNKILAVWDCPYVKKFQTEIAAYAEICELEPIFKKNKE